MNLLAGESSSDKLRSKCQESGREEIKGENVGSHFTRTSRRRGKPFTIPKTLKE